MTWLLIERHQLIIYRVFDLLVNLKGLKWSFTKFLISLMIQKAFQLTDHLSSYWFDWSFHKFSIWMLIYKAFDLTDDSESFWFECSFIKLLIFDWSFIKLLIFDWWFRKLLIWLSIERHWLIRKVSLARPCRVEAWSLLESETVQSRQSFFVDRNHLKVNTNI